MENSLPIEFVQELGRALYKYTPTVRRFTSHNNAVYLLDFNGAVPDKVIKIAGNWDKAPSRIVGEQKALRVLRDLDFPVPQIEFTQDDIATPRPFFTMSRLPGEKLEAYWSRPQPWEQQAWHKAGQFIARFRSVPLDAVQNILQPPWNDFDGLRTRLERHNFLCSPFREIVDQAQQLAQRDEQCFIDPEYSASSIITDGTSFGVVDFEEVTTGSPLLVLGTMIANTREYGGRDDHIRWLLEGFKSMEQIGNEGHEELHVHEMFALVGQMGWKLGAGVDHDTHARAIAMRVEQLTHL